MNTPSTSLDPESTPKGKGPRHLQARYARQKKETIDLVRKSVAILQKRGTAVSIENIRLASFEISGGERKLSATTIYRNSDVDEIYRGASDRRPRARINRFRLYLAGLPENTRVKVAATLRRLQQKSKVQLAIELFQARQDLEDLNAELTLLHAAELDKIVPESIRVLRR